MDAPEEWRPVPEWEGLYEVSNLGAVRSLCGANMYGPYKRSRPVLLRPDQNRDGYLIVDLHRGPKVEYARVHRLVLLAFAGLPRGRVAGHLNAVRTDNRLENLRWVTHQENSNHQIGHGTRYRGAKHHRTKLTEDQVLAIRERARAESHGTIAADYGVSRCTVQSIARRRNWGWL